MGKNKVMKQGVKYLGASITIPKKILYYQIYGNDKEEKWNDRRNKWKKDQEMGKNSRY